MAFAISERDFKTCVQIKDFTIEIGKYADKGIKRESLKEKAPSSSELIDFVYDFHGVKTNQQIAENQMENCLKYFNKK